MNSYMQSALFTKCHLIYHDYILDLQSVTAKVASSLKDAEAAIQSSLATLSAGDISDDNREKVLKQLGKYLSFET